MIKFLQISFGLIAFLFALNLWVDYCITLGEYGDFICIAPFIAFMAFMLSQSDENK